MRILNLKKRIILNALGVSRRQNKWGPDWDPDFVSGTEKANAKMKRLMKEYESETGKSAGTTYEPTQGFENWLYENYDIRMNSRRRADREISESEYSSYVMQMELLGEVKSKVGGTSALVSGNPSSEQDGLVVVDEDIDENEKYYYYNNIRELESEWGTVNWDSGATPY